MNNSQKRTNKVLLTVKIIFTAILSGISIYVTTRLVLQDNGLWVIPWALLMMVIMIIIGVMWIPAKHLDAGNAYDVQKQQKAPPSKKRKSRKKSMGLLGGAAYLISCFLSPKKSKKFTSRRERSPGYTKYKPGDHWNKK